MEGILVEIVDTILRESMRDDVVPRGIRLSVGCGTQEELD